MGKLLKSSGEFFFLNIVKAYLISEMINIDLDLSNLSSALLLDTPNFCRGDESLIKYWNDNRIVQS